MYHSDTVYSTTTFRPVSPLPRPPPSPLPPPPPPPPPPPATPSPQRTRKLETPLHFDGGLFSDIRSKEGKLLSKVTVDRVHSSSRHDVTESPSRLGTPTSRDYVDDVTKTETITNEDVIKIKFTPVMPEIDVPRLLTPSQFIPLPPQVEYIKDDFEDLQSYKMVNSVCKGNKFESDALCDREKSVDSLSNIYNFEPIIRPHSPLANFIVPEQLTKIDEYLQKSLNERSNEDGARTISPTRGAVARGEPQADSRELKENNIHEQMNRYESSTSMNVSSCEGRDEHSSNKTSTVKEEEKYAPPVAKTDRKNKSKVDSVYDKNTGVLRAIYNMPIHYHAIILCVLLIVYNLVYQYIKQHCQVKGK